MTGTDFKFTHNLEDRALRLTAFVPQRSDGSVIGVSGVTILFGVDLGQQGEGEIKDWPEDVKALVRPYLSPLRGEDAKEYLEQHPLHLTAHQGLAVQSAMEAACEARLASHLGMTWGKVPAAVREALCSLSWQLGGIWARKDCKAVWQSARREQWHNLAAEIRVCGPAGYKTRRNAEANHIEKGLA